MLYHNSKRVDTERMSAEKDAIIKELKDELAHVAAVAERNGTNTGIPTTAALSFMVTGNVAINKVYRGKLSTV